jgi:ABC-type polysaccharide/polyol phosphate export permease
VRFNRVAQVGGLLWAWIDMIIMTLVMTFITTDLTVIPSGIM